MRERSDDEIAREWWEGDHLTPAALAREGREYGEAKVLREVVERNRGECLSLCIPGCASSPVEERCDVCWATAQLEGSE